MTKKPHYCGPFTRELPGSDFVPDLSAAQPSPRSVFEMLYVTAAFLLLSMREGSSSSPGRAVGHSSATGQQGQGQDSGDSTAVTSQLPAQAGQRQDVYSSTDTITIHGIITSRDSLYQHWDRLGALSTQTLLGQNAAKEFSPLINTPNTKRIKPCTPAMGTISKLIKII